MVGSLFRLILRFITEKYIVGNVDVLHMIDFRVKELKKASFNFTAIIHFQNKEKNASFCLHCN